MILDKLVEATRNRIEKQKKVEPLSEIKNKALKMPKLNFEFEKAIKDDGMTFICEVKKASPSKGLIAEEFDYLKIAKEYESAGAGCISCLTETDYFKGSDKYLKEIAANVDIPVLRKDFTIDEYMIYQARVLGAKAVLLICSILTIDEMKKYIDLCDSMGMSALVEAHDIDEINMAIEAGARIIGVNNRDLKTFNVDINNSIRLRKIVPSDILFVAESGIKTSNDIKQLENNNVNAVLIGETLMRAKDKRKMLNELKGN